MSRRGDILMVISALISLTAGLGTNIDRGTQDVLITPSDDVQTKALGRNLVLTCSTIGLSPEVDAHLKWFDGGNDEITLTTGRVYIEPSGPQILKLYITEIQNGDAGLYTCTGEFAGNPQKSVQLDIYKDITFDHAPSPQHPKNGTDSLIECRVSGQPQPTITWKHGGLTIITGGRYDVRPDQGLLIYNASKDMDDGIYTCRAEVVADGRMEKRDIQVDIHIAPKMSQNVGEVTGIEGHETSLSCYASGLPPPKYEFYKNDEQNAVQPSERVVIDADGGAIHFKPLVKGDEGSYRCLASNDVGEDSNTGELIVQVPPHIHTLINQTAQEGQSQTLRCVADGDPPPTMTFHKMGNELPYEIGDGNEGGDVVLRNDEAGILDMTVKNLSPEDTANYTCIATNQAGDHKVNGTLIVHYSPRFAEDHITEFYLWAGKTRNITCFSQCEPEPKIRWYKDGRELLNNETFKIYEMRYNSNLQITCREEDQGWIYGEYTCEAENGVGKGDIDLNVLRARLPGAPQDVTVREQSPTLLVLDVTPPKDNGGIPIYGYRVQYEQSIQDFALAEAVRIENLKPATAYLFQIMAKNEVGVGNSYQHTHTTEAIREPYPIEPNSGFMSGYPYDYDLSWEVPKTGGMPIEEYEFKIRKVKFENGGIVEPLEDWIRSVRPDNPQSPMISNRFSNLSPGTHHQVEVRARNSIGWSQPNYEFVFLTMEGNNDNPLAVDKIEVETTMKPAGAQPVTQGLETGAVIGIVIVVFLIFLIIVDVSCYFMNGCGVLMCLCVNLCGKPQPISKEKAMEEGESKEALKQPVEEAVVAQEQDVVVDESPEKEEPREVKAPPPPEDPPADVVDEDEKKPPSEIGMEELEPEDKDKPDELIDVQEKVPEEIIKDGGHDEEIEPDEKTPLNEDPKVKEAPNEPTVPEPVAQPTA